MVVAVSGNIGAGKSTLATKLASHYNCQALLESVSDNPYLDDFYQDMARWAFPLQIYFLNNRFRQGLSVAQSEDWSIIDRTIYEDAEIFARNLHELGYLSNRDYQNYRGIYVSMRELLSPPDLVLYLKGTVETFQQRIARRMTQTSRSRKNEDKIPATYLEQLNQRYDDWVHDFSLAPVLTINIDAVDLEEPKAFRDLIARIDAT